MMPRSRPQRLFLGTGLLAVIAWIVMSASGLQVMPSYLAGWLFVLALPLGALPVVMLLELFAVQDWAIMQPLRRILLLQPVASLFAIPIMFRVTALYHHPGMASQVPAGWMASGFFIGRMIAILLIWTGLALLFSRPRIVPRQGLAAIGLFLHFAIGSLAGLDWVLALDPGMSSSAFGLLMISIQISVALCAGVLGLTIREQIMPSELAPMMTVAIACWMFLHFIQYLIIWSGNLPTEIGWYQHRITGLGGSAIWFGFVAAVLTLCLLLPHRLVRAPWALASVAVMLLLVHLIEMLWLVTPGFRGHFTLSLPDVPVIIGAIALAGSLLIAAEPVRRNEATQHDRT